MDWKKSLREICAERFLQQPPIIEGLGHIVEIDESHLVRRKYNVGHLVREQWVFGGYDNTDKVGFLVPVERRNADTLLPIIEQYIRPITEIHSDLWRSYGGIRALPGYNNLQVNHSVHFVDPDTQACTNHVKNMWKNAKISHSHSKNPLTHCAHSLIGPKICPPPKVEECQKFKKQ